MKHFALLRQIRVGIVDALTIWRYELRNVIRDQGVFIFFVLVPLGYPLLYSFIYTQETVRNVPVTVVDCSHSKLSREFVRKIDASPDLQVKSYCADMEEAKQMMRDKAVYGIVYIPEDFSRNLNEGKQAIITAMSDMSGLLYYKAVLATCTDVSLEMNENIQLQTLGATTKEQELQSTEPIPYDNVAMFNPTNGFATFLIPAVLMLIIQQTLLIGVGMSNGTARETNRWGDLLPVLRHYNGTFRIVMGKSLCYLMIYAITATWIAVPFLIMIWLLKKTKSRDKAGYLSGVFLILYSLARIICEFFREPDSFLGFLYAGATMGQLLSLPMLIVGLYLVFRKKEKHGS
jgi:ABC-2 type transport system permease protein